MGSGNTCRKPASGRSANLRRRSPYTARGCVAQAWSVAEVLRCLGRPARSNAVRMRRDGGNCWQLTLRHRIVTFLTKKEDGPTFLGHKRDRPPRRARGRRGSRRCSSHRWPGSACPGQPRAHAHLSSVDRQGRMARAGRRTAAVPGNDLTDFLRTATGSLSNLLRMPATPDQVLLAAREPVLETCSRRSDRGADRRGQHRHGVPRRRARSRLQSAAARAIPAGCLRAAPRPSSC